MKRGFKFVSIVPNKGVLGFVRTTELPVWFHPDIGIGPREEKWIERELLIDFAGVTAEKRLTGKYNWRDAGNDCKSIAVLASIVSGSSRDGNALIERARLRAWEFVNLPSTWVQIKVVAIALLKHRKLTARRARAICRAALDR